MDGSGNWISVRDTYIKPEINNQDVRLIDRTHLGQFLDSPEYNEALKLAYINEGYDSVAVTMASNYTRGTGTTGPWAEASSIFLKLSV